MAAFQFASSWSNRSVRALLLDSCLVGMIVAAYYMASKMEVAYVLGLMRRAAWESSAIDLMIWTIGSHGQGLLMIPLASCIFLTMSKMGDDSLSRVVAHGSRRRYMASRIVDAVVVSLLVSSMCFAIWFAVVLSEGVPLLNWDDEASFYYGQTLGLSETGVVGSFVLFYLCILICSLYASLFFVAVEILSQSAVAASVCVMSVFLACYFLPWVNELFGVFPDMYTLTSAGFPLSWLVPPMACVALSGLAAASVSRRDFMARNR